MKIPYRIDHLPQTSNKRSGLLLVPKYLTIHSTANESSSAKNERDWLTNPLNTDTTGWHVCVDEQEAVEAVPLDEAAWHAGDGYNGTGNRQSVSVEICESGNRMRTLRNAAMLAAELLKKLNIPLENIRQHHDWNTKKNCPRILRISNLWTGFLTDVQTEFNDETPQWKKDIISKAWDVGLITEWHNPDDVVEKWFVLAVAINIYDALRKQVS